MLTSKKSRVVAVLVVILALAAAYVATGEAWSRIKRVYAESQPRPTEFPSAMQPDQICLTWSEDPSTSQTIQWRIAPAVEDAFVQYRPSTANDTEIIEKAATSTLIEDPQVKNDPVNKRFSVALQGLKPATTYKYRVGSKQGQSWSPWSEFTTAPAGPVPFSFIYLGDSQGEWSKWQTTLSTAAATDPHAAFYMVAGDLVDDGYRRDLWDGFFHAGEPIFNHCPLVPVPGNHDYSRRDTPRMYLDFFTLPINGPANISPELAYSFRYGDAFFVALDPNLEPATQTPWLDQQLSTNNAVWKIAIYHQPAYSSSPHRDNPDIREQWGPLFDKYHLDLALQGHDHAYLRTYPMNAEKRRDSFTDGTVYIVSVSGPKHYDQDKHEYAAVEKKNTSTFQVIEITTNPDRLAYHAYDADKKTVDEFVIEK